MNTILALNMARDCNEACEKQIEQVLTAIQDYEDRLPRLHKDLKKLYKQRTEIARLIAELSMVEINTRTIEVEDEVKDTLWGSNKSFTPVEDVINTYDQLRYANMNHWLQRTNINRYGWDGSI